MGGLVIDEKSGSFQPGRTREIRRTVKTTLIIPLLLFLKKGINGPKTVGIPSQVKESKCTFTGVPAR